MSSFQGTFLRKNATSDTLGAFASALCALHCVATPLIFLAHASTADHHASAPLWWGILDYFFLIISFVAIHYSAKKTSLRWMPFALYFAWALLAGYILIETFHLFHLSHALIYFPAFGLVFLHVYNRRHCRCEEDDCCVSE
ncbi:MAG: MerC domain-containing protein [Bacteroidota bacterium]